MKFYNKVKNLQTNQKVIGGCLSLLLFPPLIFGFLTYYSYKDIKNGVVSGILTLVFGSLTLLTALSTFAVLSGVFTSNNETKVEKKVEDSQTVVEEPVKEEKLPEDQMTFKVLSVTDGDTIRIDYYGESTPVRFIGVDAPEINHSSEPVQCFGPEAKKYIEDKILDKQIRLEKEPKDDNEDTFDRLLRYVFLEDGTNLIEQALKEGYLLENTYTQGYKYQDLYTNSQQEAKDSKVGFWDPQNCNGDIYTGTYKEKEEITPVESSVSAPAQQVVPSNSNVGGTAPSYVAPSAPQQKTSGSYVCDCGKACGKMSSCEEAYYQLNTCGCGARDNDKDGIPCESICR